MFGWCRVPSESAARIGQNSERVFSGGEGFASWAWIVEGGEAKMAAETVELHKLKVLRPVWAEARLSFAPGKQRSAFSSLSTVGGSCLPFVGGFVDGLLCHLSESAGKRCCDSPHAARLESPPAPDLILLDGPSLSTVVLLSPFQRTAPLLFSPLFSGTTNHLKVLRVVVFLSSVFLRLMLQELASAVEQVELFVIRVWKFRVT